MIKFEKCKGYEDIATIPKRSTKGSAGYDFYNTDKEITIPAHGTVISNVVLPFCLTSLFLS